LARHRSHPAAWIVLLWTACAVPSSAAQPIEEALALHQAGKLRAALRLYRTLVQDPDPAVAATARHNACAVQMDLGDYRGALPDCRAALPLLRSQGDPEAVSQALNNLGLALEMLGDTAAAERSYGEALALNRSRGDAEGQVINLGNLGALATSAGRYDRALAFHTEAAALSAQRAGEPWAAEQLQIARINQGVVLEKLGAYREALDLYRHALREAGEPRRRAALLVNTGVLYRNLGDPVRAADSFRAAVALFGKLGDAAALSNAWLNLALAQHLNLERPAEAEASYREALRLAEASGDRTEEIQDLFYLGRLLLATGRLGEAETVFRRSLAAAQASGSAEGIWSAREGLGRIAVARGDLPSALRELTGALSQIEKVRADLTRGARREGWFGDKRSVYAAAVAVLSELERRQPGKGWAEQALETVQRAKARELLDALGGGRPSAPARAADLRARAGDGTILEYFLGETDLYRWIITRDGLQMADLGPQAPLLAAVARVHRALAHGGEPAAADLTALSQTLLGNAGPLREPLRIAADGRLRYLPFELLADPAAPGKPLVERAAVVYLPSASTLRTAPLFSPLPAGARAGDGRGAGGEGPRPAGTSSERLSLRLAGFGDPALPAPAAGSLTPAGLLVARFGLAPLPAAGRELAAVARLLGGRRALFTGPQATERSFRNAVARGARVVHLATHTVVDERPGRGAAILLSPEGDDDGLLAPDEIARLADHTDLTVLAACRTALSGDTDGGALASLTGSFLAAGSQGVVATLWDVDDAAAAVFMAQLYDRLGRGDPPAEALRRAKQRLRADPRWNRPSLWAGYVLIGDAPPVAPGRSVWGWAAGGVIVLVAVVGWVGWRRRKRPLTARPGRAVRPAAAAPP
jgi:CHAT domain-containing protein/Tfp pilus assembly protein PilF